jgi:hypothetical protein
VRSRRTAVKVEEPLVEGRLVLAILDEDREAIADALADMLLLAALERESTERAS